MLSPFRALVITMGFALTCSVSVIADELPLQTTLETVSTLDGETQPILCWAPTEATSHPTPLFVFLHSWSSDYKQDNTKWLIECVRHRWIWLHPNFRGINQSAKACGSRFARQDVLDAIDLARKTWKVDEERIYLAGVSGGGHMSLLMAGHHPEAFSAVSSWVGPTDLADWHQFHVSKGRTQKYAKMIEASLGGAPGESAERDADYKDRSPVYHLHQTSDLPISIWAGIEDGHSGSVPISHSLRAFNAIAKGQGTVLISETEIQQLLNRELPPPALSEDFSADTSLDRKVHLRRLSGPSMVTIFDGGHESIPAAAFEWLTTQKRRAQRAPESVR
ncbi:MAG: alpha/beta hydrolase family protein [Planctomycetota bacterium]